MTAASGEKLREKAGDLVIRAENGAIILSSPLCVLKLQIKGLSVMCATTLRAPRDGVCSSGRAPPLVFRGRLLLSGRIRSEDVIKRDVIPALQVNPERETAHLAGTRAGSFGFGLQPQTTEKHNS